MAIPYAALVYRPMGEADRGFVFDTWLRSYRRCHDAGPIPMRMYYRVYREVIETLLANGVTVTVAAMADDPDTVLGYVATSTHEGQPVIHYAYTKQLFREKGVLTNCLKSLSIDPRAHLLYTFRTPEWKLLASKRPWRWAQSLARYLGAED